MNQFPPPRFYGEPEQSESDGPAQTPPTYLGAAPPTHVASFGTSPGSQKSRGRGRFFAGVATLAVLAAASFGAITTLNRSTSGDAGSTASLTSAAPFVQRSATDAPEGSVEEVAALVLPSVVRIDVAGPSGSGSGSGIILSPDGKILTNNHVVSLDTSTGASQIRVSFSDGSRAMAKILGSDPLTDTAVIQAEGVSDLDPATIGQSADLAVGQDVVAIGSPFGLDATVTSGIVSALNRPVKVGSDAQGTSTTYPAIQTDASINPGNSGGPLVDMTGSVIGINSSIRAASASYGEPGGSIGLGFAIPIDEVLPIVEQLAAGEVATHARLGVTVADAGAESIEDPLGAQLAQVSSGSTAAKAGLRPGDVITRINDRLINSADALVATVRSYRPGDEVEVSYSRNGSDATTTLTLDSDATNS